MCITGSEQDAKNDEWLLSQNRSTPIDTPVAGQSQWQVGGLNNIRDGYRSGSFAMDELSGSTLANRLNPNNVHYDSQLAARSASKVDGQFHWHLITAYVALVSEFH